MYKINRTRLVLLVLCLIILPISSKCFYDFFDKINEESNNFVWQTNKRYSSLKLCLDCLLQLQFCVVLKNELRANLGLLRGDNGGHLAAEGEELNANKFKIFWWKTFLITTRWQFVTQKSLLRTLKGRTPLLKSAAVFKGLLMQLFVRAIQIIQSVSRI